MLDTENWKFNWGCLRRRPNIELDIYRADNGEAWDFFQPHHYLKAPLPIAAKYYIGEIEGRAVSHMAVSTAPGLKSARFARLVVMPEWQGVGIGMKFLERVAQSWLDGENPYKKKMTGIIHTSHPGLLSALNRSSRWVCTSQHMGGVNKKECANLIRNNKKSGPSSSGYGGHLRAFTAFRYVGDRKTA